MLAYHFPMHHRHTDLHADDAPMSTPTVTSAAFPASPPANVDRLPDGVSRVARELERLGHPQAPVMLDQAARTAQQAADALGVALGQIAKSIVFRRKPDGTAVLVVTSGDRRVDEAKVQALVCAALPPGAPVPAEGLPRLGRANAEFVKQATGFSIGGVSPLAHASPCVTLVDRDLFRFPEVWAAAGHPHAVFRLSPHDLVAWSGAPAVDVVVVESAQSSP